MDYAEREGLKREAGREYAAAQNDQQRARAIEKLIDAHYERSREVYGGKHPAYEIYAAHWLEAQKDRIGQSGGLQLGAGEFAILRQRYPAPRSPRIPPGMSYWHSPARYKEAMRKARNA